MDDFEFEGFGIVLVCHVAGDDALEQVFVDASGGNMVDYCLHALHEVVGVPIIAIMHEEPDADIDYFSGSADVERPGCG